MSQAKNDLMKRLTGLDWFHSRGYTGQGIKIWLLENPGTEDQHEITSKLKACIGAPGAIIEIKQNEDKVWDEAIAQGVRIVNISMDSFSKEGSKKFVDQGGIVVAATGNNTPSWFVGWEWVIDVGAYWETGVVPPWSAKSTELDLVTFIPFHQASDGSWVQNNGTSFAAPYLSGALGSLLSYYDAVGYKTEGYRVRRYLLDHAVDIYDLGKDTISGAGYAKIYPLKIIDFPINENRMVVDGANIPLDQGAVILNGRTMLPVFHLSKALGVFVGWLAKLNTKGTARVFIE